jgi:cytochrome c3-like protein
MAAKGPLAAALLCALLLGGVGARALTRVGIHQGYQPTQPIAFSHRLHAGENHVPCLYCHYAAPRSRHAGIPAASVCMNCHALLERQTAELAKLNEALAQRRPIQWIKVHNLPDFVHFDHSQHVLASVACQECHGPVETMDRVRQEAPLTMGWCLDCHRARKAGAAVSTVATGPPAHAPLAGLDCSKCHH